MPDEPIDGVKFSEFPSYIPGSSDELVGLHNGNNARFSVSNFILSIRQGLSNLFVPQSRTINGKGLSSDISLTATDVGARPNTWTPSAADVGAQDTITASGILKGDGAGGVSAATAGTDYQAPLTFDNTPTASSNNPVKSGGVYDDVRTRVPKYGKGQNLLRNWYFAGGGTGRGVFPVNQRGSTSGTTANNTYSINAWKWTYGTRAGSWALNSTGLTLTPDSASDTVQMFEYLENTSELNGKSITASILRSDGTLKHGTITRNSSINQFIVDESDVGLRIFADGNFRIYVRTTQTIVAVSLELGTEQTLAHQENGVWVLNEIPDYEYELYRCMTSTADSSDTYANKSLATEQQLAYVETGTTASRNYSVGECFCWNGLLYRVKLAISSGEPFTVGTNCEQVTVGDELKGRTYTLYSHTAILDVHSGDTIPINSNVPALDKYKFIVLRLTTSSSDSSSTRGVVMVPVTGIRLTPYVPAVVGGVSGWIRISASSDYLSFIIISTSFTSLYLANIYGII